MIGDLLHGDRETVTAELAEDFTAAAIVDALVIMCEQLTARKGWDQPHRLFTLDRIDTGSAEHLALLASEVGVHFENMLGWQIADAMVRTAAAITRSNRHAMRLLEGRDIAAWMLAFEAWGIEGDAAREHEASIRAGTRIANLTERIEMRVVFAVDRTGVAYQANQRRGQDSVEVFVDRGAGVVTGNFLTGLRALVESLP